MLVAFACDDENECARAVADYLARIAEVRLIDGGSWPEFARNVRVAVATSEADFGVVMCWTGTGTSIDRIRDL